jgi:hypothetical protein
MASFSKFYFWALGAGGLEALTYYLDVCWANSSGDTSADPATCDRDPHARGGTFPASAEETREHASPVRSTVVAALAVSLRALMRP